MHKLLAILLLIITSVNARAQRMAPVDKGSKVEFTVNGHKEGNVVVKGRLSGLKGSILFDPKDLGKASFDVTVSAGSANTGVAERDRELKGLSYLSGSVYPMIRIKSASVVADGHSGILYLLNGSLTLKGITKPVRIQFTATPAGTGYLFRGSFHLNRLDYGVGDKADADNDVAVYIVVNAVKR